MKDLKRVCSLNHASNNNTILFFLPNNKIEPLERHSPTWFYLSFPVTTLKLIFINWFTSTLSLYICVGTMNKTLYVSGNLRHRHHKINTTKNEPYKKRQ